MRHIPLAAVLAALPLVAQSRSTVLVGPPALGATCYVQHVLPAGSVGHVAGFLWSGPFAGAVPVPGLAVNGLLRVDPATLAVVGLSVTSGLTAPTMPLAVPSSTALLGSQLDCQSFDLDLASVFQLAANDVPLTVVLGPGAALAMVAIAPGTFAMGSSVPLGTAPYFHVANAQPTHPVTISRPFWIGRYEVTQAQYQAVMGANPSVYQGASFPNAAQRPVERVTWANAVAYCAALTASEQAAGRVPAGYQYRLPTEAEWEYCCRAGTTTEYHYGATLLCPQANFFYSNHSASNCAANSQTQVVGSYAPNAWGLFDMHGNVFEWCLDAWDGAANYPSGAVTDPLSLTGGDRHYRGGAHAFDSSKCRSACRNRVAPTFADGNLGFRVVLGPVLGAPSPDPSLNMVAIAPGTFQMGSAVTPLFVPPYFNQDIAGPVHAVTISRPFWIGRYEVTQAQYQALMGANPSFHQGPGYADAPQRPVEQVNWNDAVAYCAALTASEQAAGRVPPGYQYRLPTEAEWEYCCRAGTTTEFHTGTGLFCGQAKFTFSYHAGATCNSAQSVVVGGYAPNAWGLYDMHGNVHEWTLDRTDGTPYASGPVTDPFIASGPGRVFRGGSWDTSSYVARSAYRRNTTPTTTGRDFGFRVALAPVLP